MQSIVDNFLEKNGEKGQELVDILKKYREVGE